MSKGYIAVLDSGVGGLNVLKKLSDAYPFERYIYFGDNDNAPYGNKSLDELWKITKRNLEYLLNYDVKLLVLGCNTLSTRLYNDISAFVKVPTIGVFPPVDYALRHYKKVLLLSTVRTAENYTDTGGGLQVVGLSNLAKDIENNIFNISNVKIEDHLDNVLTVRKGEFDAVILGCTHYSFIKKQIFDHLKPLAIFSSEDFVAEDVAVYIDGDKSSVKYKRNNILFVGKNAKTNKIISVKSGFLW